VRTARFRALLAAALLVAAPLRAQEESVHLDYDASEGCPDRAAFIAEITARTSRARFVDAAADVRSFRATIRNQADRAVGSLVSNTGQNGAERRVSGKTCSEVVSALALITALAIDPSASTRLAPTPERSVASTGKPAAATSTVASSNVAPAAPERGSTPPTASSWGIAWALGGEALYGFTSGASLTMVGGSLQIEVGPWAREHTGSLFRVGAVLRESSAVRPPDFAQLGEATFHLLGGRVAWSPAHIRIATSFELHPWLSAEVAQFKGSGENGPGGLLSRTYDAAVTWLAVGQDFEARWRLAEPFWIALDFQAIEPILRPKFTFNYTPGPPTTISSVPTFAGAIGVGIGGRIL
jgi:hypothetical protein